MALWPDGYLLARCKPQGAHRPDARNVQGQARQSEDRRSEVLAGAAAVTLTDCLENADYRVKLIANNCSFSTPPVLDLWEGCQKCLRVSITAHDRPVPGFGSRPEVYETEKGKPVLRVISLNLCGKVGSVIGQVASLAAAGFSPGRAFHTLNPAERFATVVWAPSRNAELFVTWEAS